MGSEATHVNAPGSVPFSDPQKRGSAGEDETALDQIIRAEAGQPTVNLKRKSRAVLLTSTQVVQQQQQHQQQQQQVHVSQLHAQAPMEGTTTLVPVSEAKERKVKRRAHSLVGRASPQVQAQENYSSPLQLSEVGVG